MKYSQIYLVVLVTIGVIGFVVAEGMPVPHFFNGGDPASATKVNENFQDLADRIAALPGSQVFDYKDFKMDPAITSKTFNDSDAAGNCSTTPPIENDFSGVEIRHYERIQTSETTAEILMTRENKSSTDILCRLRKFKYIESPDAYTIVQDQIFQVFEQFPVPHSTRNFNPGQVVRSSAMQIGVPLISASMYDRVYPEDAGFPVDYSEPGGKLETVTALGLEDVEVPYDKFTGCLKLQIHTPSSTVSSVRFSWYCKGIGEVKRVMGNTSFLRKWELASVAR